MEEIRKKYTKNVKHPELLEYYYSYEGEKTTYRNFFNRHTKLGYSKEDAIKPGEMKAGFKAKGLINEEGRECTKCGEFKGWEQYPYDKTGTKHRATACKECRNKAHREYRERDGIKDKLYKKNKRKLFIGEYIALLDPVYIDGFPREDVYEVLGYQFKKGYQLRSVLTGYYRNACTGDNPNSIKYYRVEKPDFIIYEGENANSEEKERAKERAWME